MRTHTNNFKTNIKNLGRQFNVRVVYGGTTLQNEQINNATLNYNGDILKSVMKMLKLDSNIDIPLNTQITFEFGLLVGNSYEYINYGTFIVEKSEKQENTNSYLLTCYDKMLYSMKPYEDLGITYPITIRNYISALCTKLGLQFQNASDNFVNYNKQIPNELYLDEQGNSLDYNYRDVLDELAQVTASTICINDSGKLEIRYITNTNDTIDEEFLKNVNVNFGEQYGAINTITFSRSADSDSISKSIPENLPDTDKIEIKISDNQILNGNNRDEFIDGILNKLYGLSYYVNDFSSTGITYYDLCDRYNITVGENTYSCVMLNDEININNGLVENIFTNMPKTSKTDYSKVDKTDRKANQTTLIVNKQEGRIDAVVSQVDEIEQELSSPTSRKTGEYFDLQDALDEPLVDFSMEGDTQQDSTTGQQLFNYKDQYDVNQLYTIDNDGWISATYNNTGSSTVFLNYYTHNLNLQTSTNYVVILEVKSVSGNASIYTSTTHRSSQSNTNVYRYFSDLTNRGIYKDNITTISDFSGTTSGIRSYLRFGAGQSGSITFRLSVLANTSITPETFKYEPYTNGASPNPNYPQPINVVTGRNDIQVCGKNRIGILQQGGINLGGGGTDTSATNRVRTNFIITDGVSKYTISNNGTIANQFGAGFYDKNKKFISAYSGGGWVNFSNTITIPNNVKYIKFMFRNSSNVDITPELDYKIQIEEGSTASTYEAYTGQSQLISLGVENLFDKDNVTTGYLTYLNGVDTASNWRITDYIKISPNTPYIMSGCVNGTGANPSRCYYDINKTFISGVKHSNNSTSFVDTSPNNAYYMRESIKEADLNTAMIEKGTKANSYSEYGKPYIELNKISTYQDYLFYNTPSSPYYNNELQDYKWYLHKEIGKVVLDGTNVSFASKSGSTSNNQFSTQTISDILKPQYGTIISNILSNMFISKAPNTIYANDTIGIGVNTDRSITCGFGLSSTLTTKELANTWLSTHNTIVNYVLATPTNTEITNEELLGQLNNLMNTPLLKGLNHITNDTANLYPNLNIEYVRDTALNENYVKRPELNNYYTKSETTAQIQINNSSIQQSVAEIQTTLDSEGNAISSLSNQVTNLQTSTSQQINVINQQLIDGVEKVKTTTGYTFDSEGMSITKGDDFKNLITDRNQQISSHNKEIMFMGYDDTLQKTVARIEELESRKATIGVHRCETLTRNNKKRTAWFYVGGGN